MDMDGQFLTAWDETPRAAVTATVGQDPAVSRSVRQSRLRDVDHWLYLIDVNLSEQTVSKISNSAHDMVVIDYIPSEAANTDYPMAQTVARLKKTRADRVVLAYIDIGQAEDYRVYWQDDWKIGHPQWITALDPDGWEGNYPVAFWAEEYQNIWLADGGLLDGIVEAGFDGVYLDWVEAYDDPNVIAAAQSDGLDPAEVMVEWVGAIGQHVRAYDSGQIVVAQNAGFLLQRSDYREVIDAIAQEQVWFDGGADNRPPGDCPLPATDADIGHADYLAALSPVCRAQHDRHPDSTLHVSSAWYLTQLEVATRYGIPVFTVDYAVDPSNMETAVRRARDRGFTPFVGPRGLDRFVPPHK